jgi:lysophospholipase L1-like esterase
VLWPHGRQLAVRELWHPYYVGLGALAVGTILPVPGRVVDVRWKAQWRQLVLIWSSCVALLWLATAYMANDGLAFHISLLLIIMLSILCRFWFRLPGPAILAANTLVLFCAGLPLVELCRNGTGYTGSDPQGLLKYASFQTARTDRRRFNQWWAYYWAQWQAVDKAIVIHEPDAPIPVHFRPNSQAVMVQCPIHINSQGLRGKEIPVEKRNSYRVLALGESTTFGFTIRPSEQPWPELLEDLINQRLKPPRPVEVVNAGMPIVDLAVNVRRLRDQLLAFKPDMIISYHGINGFHLLDSSVPPTSGKPAPAYHQRPLTLLADCEYAVKMGRYRSRFAERGTTPPLTFTNLLNTAYGQAYEELISIATSNHIRLVISTFSMALNDRSPPEDVEVFRPAYPAVGTYIRANLGHTALVHLLAQEHPELCLVDTYPRLDGETSKYLDLIHFTHEGDRQMAEAFFDGIRDVLRHDLVLGQTAELAQPKKPNL